MTRAWIYIVALVLAGALGQPVSAEGRPGYGGLLVASLTSEPTTFDPLAARSHAEFTVVGLVFDTLYRAAPDGTLVPHLAAAAPVVDRAGTTIRIAIRTGVRWHDSSALGVDDVVASLRRAVARSAGWLPGVATITADGDAVVLSLRAANPELPTLLTLPALSVTQRGAAPSSTQPIGSGPFMVTAIDRARRRIQLRANPAHVAGRPYLEQLQLDWFTDGTAEARRYETGGAQVASRGASVFVGHAPRFATVEVESAATLLSYVGFGRDHASITTNIDFRRALDAGLVRGGLAGTGVGERLVPSATPIAADLGGAPRSAGDVAGRHDAALVAMARAEASVTALAASARAALRLRILIDATRFDDRELAERVARALDKLGITATIDAVSAADFASKVAAGSGDFYIGQLASVSASAGVTWLQAFEAGGDSWVRDRLAKGTFTVAGAAAQFMSTLPIVPLVHRAVRYQLRSDLRGASVDVLGRLSVADMFMFGSPRAAS